MTHLSALLAWTAFLAATASAQSQQSSEISPMVKGLCIGMDFAKAEQWCHQHFDDTILGYEILPADSLKALVIAHADMLKMLQKESGNARIDAFGREQQLGLAHQRASFIFADSGKVVAILFSPEVVDYLFKAGNMSSDELATTFADAYKLGKLKTNAMMTYSCTTPEGVLVKIARDKTISITKVTAPADVRKSFD